MQSKFKSIGFAFAFGVGFTGVLAGVSGANRLKPFQVMHVHAQPLYETEAEKQAQETQEDQEIKEFIGFLKQHSKDRIKMGERLIGNPNASWGQILNEPHKPIPKIQMVWNPPKPSKEAPAWQALTKQEMQQWKAVYEAFFKLNKDHQALSQYFTNRPDATPAEIETGVNNALPERLRQTRYNPYWGPIKIEQEYSVAGVKEVKELTDFLTKHGQDRVKMGKRLVGNPNASWGQIIGMRAAQYKDTAKAPWQPIRWVLGGDLVTVMIPEPKETSPDWKDLTEQEKQQWQKVNDAFFRLNLDSQALSRHFTTKPNSTPEQIEKAVTNALPERLRYTGYNPYWGPLKLKD